MGPWSASVPARRKLAVFPSQELADTKEGDLDYKFNLWAMKPDFILTQARFLPICHGTARPSLLPLPLLDLPS